MISYLPHTATILTPEPVTDGYGNTVPDWSTPEESTIPCWIQQNTRATEVLDGRRALSSSFLLITDQPASLLTGVERVRWSEAPGGPLLLELSGPAEAAWTLDGFHHTEATLRRLDG